MPETPIPPMEPASAPQQERAAADTGAGSPLSVAESHARLEVSATKLGGLVKDAKTKADEAAVLYRKLRDELDETTRMLRHFERVRHPKRKVQK